MYEPTETSGPGPDDAHARNLELYHAELASRTIALPPMLYKYTTLDTALRVLNSHRLRFRSPLDFNDPFDAQWNILWETETPEFHRRVVEGFLSEDYDFSRLGDPAGVAEIREQQRRFRALSS